MLRPICLIVLLLACLGCSGGEDAAIAERTVLRIGTDATYPPFETVDTETGQPTGFDIDLVTAVCELKGWKPEFIVTPFDGIIPGLRSKKYDVVISAMTITPERAAVVNFSDPYYLAGQTIAVPLDDTLIQTVEDLVGKKVGVQLGTTGELMAKRSDEAIASFRTAARLSPGIILVQFGIGWGLLQKGEFEAALVAMQAESSEAYRLYGLAIVHYALGQADESDSALVELIEKYEQEYAYNIAVVLAFRGEVDRAFEWLDKAVQYNDPGLSDPHTSYLLTALKDDPRWLPFLESIGKLPEQLAAIEFKVTLPK